MSEWSRHTLGSSCLSIVDCEHKTAPTDETGEYFAVGTPAMKGNAINFADARRISLSTFQQWTRRMQPRAGDLLLAREAPVGPIVEIPAAENVAPGQRTVLLRPDPGLAHSRYLYFLLTSPSQQALLQVKAAGSTVAHLNVADVRDFPIKLPPLHEQRAIADVLAALDDKIAVNTTLANTADQLAAAMVCESLDPQTRVALEDIAVVTMGASPPGESYNEQRAGVSFYQGVRDFGLRYPTRRVWTTAPVRMAEAGDSLFSVRAPVGEVNVASEPTCIGRGLASIRSRTGASATLFHLLKQTQAVWSPFGAEGTIFGSINQKQLRSARVPSLRPEVASLTESKISVLEASIRSMLDESWTLAAARDALLPALMSGRLRVTDAEAIVSAEV